MQMGVRGVQERVHMQARAGHLEVVQWAHANGCPWDEEVCLQAARGGHLAVLQWSRANGCPWNDGRVRLQQEEDIW